MARPRQHTAAQVLGAIEATGPTSAAELQRALGASQPTLARRIAELGERVVAVGASRRRLYAAARAVWGGQTRWPVYRIDTAGAAGRLGVLHALQGGRWFIDFDGDEPCFAHDEFRDGLYPDLPWFLLDVRPQGFLGRAFARRHAAELDVGIDPERWSADAVLMSMLRHGDDLPGNLVVGDLALRQTQQHMLKPPSAVPESARGERYAWMAQAAADGESPGSSAGGEQPKFTARVDAANGDTRHVIGKFAKPGASAAARRWADLLRCEAHAATALDAAGVPASPTQLVEAGEFVCLESARHDRVGAHGRRGQVSLRALDAAYFGRNDDWTRAARRLEAAAWLDAAHAERLRTLHAFGRLIGNSDMHFGNVSLTRLRALPLELVPSYDMLPMRYAPANSGEVRAPEPDLAPPLPDDWPATERALPIARGFWQRVADDSAIEDAMRRVANQHLDALRAIAALPRSGAAASD
ncbi:MAG: type II toxin-antitoxin system HipA family toxin YjjJ [Silanimonas sp.]